MSESIITPEEAADTYIPLVNTVDRVRFGNLYRPAWDPMIEEAGYRLSKI